MFRRFWFNFLKIECDEEERLNTSRPDRAFQRESDSTAASLMRFWRRESFFRFESSPIRESKLESRFAVRSNSIKLEGNSIESRSWSWKLVRSRTVELRSSTIIGSSSFDSKPDGDSYTASMRNLEIQTAKKIEAEACFAENRSFCLCSINWKWNSEFAFKNRSLSVLMKVSGFPSLNCLGSNSREGPIHLMGFSKKLGPLQ